MAETSVHKRKYIVETLRDVETFGVILRIGKRQEGEEGAKIITRFVGTDEDINELLAAISELYRNTVLGLTTTRI
jgi:hypothetical protein